MYPAFPRVAVRPAACACLLAVALCGACEVVSQLPVITAFPPNFSASTPDKILPATIIQNNGPLNDALQVRCEFFFKTPPSQLANPRSVLAQRMAGNVFNCTLPATVSERVQNNDVLVFEWIVESLNDEGDATPVARSGVQEFHVGCPNPRQFLLDDQARVLSSFGALTTLLQIAGAGYVPTHPAVSTGTPAGPTSKIFRGMGVAFARVTDIPASGGFVPSGLPVSGQPNLLLFQPSATVVGQPDLASPAATFALIGWAYAVNLVEVPGPHPPNVGCFPRHEWFFHEAGVHTIDGGFSPGLGSALGVEHQRLWDLHVWARTGGPPRLSIENITGAGGATTPGGGFVAPPGSFFYPNIPIP